MLRKSVIIVTVLCLLQISAATSLSDNPQFLPGQAADSNAPHLYDFQPKSILGDILQNVFQGIEDAIREIADLIANVLTDLREGIQIILETVARSVQSVFAGTLKIIGTAIRANVNLLRKFRDALLRPALTNAKLSLQKLEKAISKALEDATQKFSDALIEIDLKAQQVLNYVQQNVEKSAEKAKEVIQSLITENNQNEFVKQCLLEQLQVVKELDRNTVDNVNKCITKQLNGANEIANSLAKILDHAFDGADTLVTELEACTAGLPNRPSFNQRRESSTCLNTVALKIQLAASQVSTDIAVKVGEVLRPLADLRAELQTCSSKNLDEMQSGLDQIQNYISDSCLN